MSFVQGKTREHLERDRILVLALVKAIEIIGEAAYQISPQTRSRTPEIPGKTSSACGTDWYMGILTLTWIFFGVPCRKTSPS
jgi:Uncharacterized conserved protein, COG2361